MAYNNAYNNNEAYESRSHISESFGLQLAQTFWELDRTIQSLNEAPPYQLFALTKRAFAKSISLWTNIKPLVLSNKVAVANTGIKTKREGYFRPDQYLDLIAKILFDIESDPENYPFSRNRARQLQFLLRQTHFTLVNIMQNGFNFFVRLDFKTKPEIDIVTENLSQNIDESTLEELKFIAGIDPEHTQLKTEEAEDDEVFILDEELEE